ncbi:MAG: MarR family transcriptional regulator [Candidatus Eisenbacteria bacterium]
MNTNQSFRGDELAADTASSGGESDEPLEIRILRAIRRIIRAVDLESKRLNGKYEITGPQLRCLVELDRRNRETTGGLANALHLSASTVVGIVDRLESKGWIQRERDSQDRRVIWSRLTESGRELLRAVPSPLQEKLSRGLEEITGLERTAIALSLERLVQLLEASDLDAAPFLETGPIAPEQNRPRG